MDIPCDVWGDYLYVEVPRSGSTGVLVAFQPHLADAAEMEVHAQSDKIFAPDWWTLQQWLAGPWRKHKRFTLVRDPVARVESYYYGYRDIDGLPSDINSFVHELPEWMREGGPSKWPQHARPQTEIIGDDLGLYDFVGRLEAVHELEAWLGRSIPRRFASDRPNERQLDERSLAVIDALYRRDYDLLGYPRPV